MNIFWEKDNKAHFDTVIKGGEVPLGTAVRAEQGDVLIGAGHPSAEDFEERLQSALCSAAELSGGTLALDVDSLVCDEAYALYVWSTVSELAEDCVADPGRSMGLLFAPQVCETTVRGVHDAIFTPVKNMKNTSFGEAGDPLKARFEAYEFEEEDVMTLQEFMWKLMEDRGYTMFSEIYKRAGVSKSTFSKFMNYTGERKCTRGTLAAIAIGMKFDLKTTQKMYHSAGLHLGEADLSDRIIRFFLREKIYSIREINYCLDYYGLPLIGARTREK